MNGSNIQAYAAVHEHLFWKSSDLNATEHLWWYVKLVQVKPWVLDNEKDIRQA